MARIDSVDREQATGKTREPFDELEARGTVAGPMVRAMATATAPARGYLDLSRAIKRSHIDGRSRRPRRSERPPWRLQPGRRDPPNQDREERA